MLSSRPIVEWWNGRVGGVVKSSNRRMWSPGVFGVVESTIRRVVEWRSWWSCRVVESSNGGLVGRVGGVVEPSTSRMVERYSF